MFRMAPQCPWTPLTQSPCPKSTSVSSQTCSISLLSARKMSLLLRLVEGPGSQTLSFPYSICIMAAGAAQCPLQNTESSVPESKPPASSSGSSQGDSSFPPPPCEPWTPSVLTANGYVSPLPALCPHGVPSTVWWFRMPVEVDTKCG